MRLWRGMLALVAAPLLAGCVPPGSLHGLYASPSDVSSDSALLGTWKRADGEDQQKWVFRKGEEGAYSLTVTVTTKGREDRSQWEARLVRVGDSRFLDLLPALRTAQRRPDASAFYVARLHLFVKLEAGKDGLRLRLLDPDWWEAQRKQGAVPLRTEELESGLSVITASTEEIRAFLLKAAADPKVFGTPLTLVPTGSGPRAPKKAPEAARKPKFR